MASPRYRSRSPRRDRSPGRGDIDSENMLGTNLYVANLSFSTTEKELEQKFSSFGTVREVSIVRDPATGHSRGFAFAVLASPSEADDAIRALHHTQLDGRTISVERAKRSGPHKATPGRYLGPRSFRSFPRDRYDDRRYDDRRDDDRRYDDRGRMDDRRYDDRGRMDERRYDDRGRMDERRYDDRGRMDERRYDDRGRMDDPRRYDDRGRMDERRYDDRGRMDDPRRYDDRRDDDPRRYDDRRGAPIDDRRMDDRRYDDRRSPEYDDRRR